MISDAEWEWVEDCCSGDFDHLVIGTSLPVLLAPGLHHARGVERGGVRRGLGSARRLAPARRSARRSTSSTGRRSSAASGGCRRCSRTSRPAAAGPPRRRSSCCRATCTTPTSPRRGSPVARSRAACCRRPARRSATRSARASGGRCARRSRAPWPPSRAGSRKPRASRSRRCAGRSRRRRRSTTRSRAWTSSGARRKCYREDRPAGLARSAPALRPRAGDRAEDGAERPLSALSRRAQSSRWMRKPRRRSEFETTKTLDSAIAAPAIIGLSRPAAASGRPATL